MEMRNTSTKVTLILLALAGVVAISLTAGGENLELYAPAEPAKKLLDEIEPRTPIFKLPYTISAAGSYYLVKNLTSDTNGIVVDANNVTIDLAGFRIIGPGSGINYGIYMNGLRNVEIRNGTVQGFTGTYQQGGGIFEANGTGHRVVGVRAVSNGRGIVVKGSGHLIKDCSVIENMSYGIHVGKSSTVTGNTCYGNHDRGISAYGSCTVAGNTCCDNGNQGILCDGSGASTVTGNTCWRNWIGIQVLDGSTVIGNTASNNEHSGIHVRRGCLVRNNTLRQNNQYNIYVEQPGNTIEGNLVTNSTNGIYFDSGGNFYSDNRTSGNTNDYNDPGDNMDGGGNHSF
ncbi:MAG: right-handed parallel beta-helix repeat-containing protein [Planctomycetota bacterium]|jgi:parallel beta-helix repeat protein